MPEHVLHLIETAGPGGAERVLIGMTKGLAEKGIASSAILLRDGWLREELERAGTEVTIIPLKRGFDGKWLSQAKALVDKKGIDAVHSHEFAMNVHGAVLARRCALPGVATVHGRNYYADKWRRRLAYRWVASLSQMVAVSNDIRRYLTTSVGISERRVAVIPNGIDPGRFQFDESLRQAVRKALGFRDDEWVIGAIGNLYRVKGHAVLLKAVRELVPRFPLQVFIAGRGEEESALRGQAEALGIADRVRFLGFRDDVQRLLCAMDLFVLPSLSEGHPLSLLEAMACRRPVVASSVGGIPEVIAQGRNGLLFESGNPTDLVTSIASLLEDSKLRRRVSAAGYEHVLKHYSLSSMVEGYLELFRSQTGVGLHAGSQL